MILAFKKTVVGIDYDGVIADTNTVKSNLILEKFGVIIEPYNCDRTNCVKILGEKRYNEISSIVYNHEYSQKALPLNNVQLALEDLSRYYDLVIITARKPEHLNSAVEWLDKHDLQKYFSAMYSSHTTSKSKIINNLSAKFLIDDDERHLKPINNPDCIGYHFHSTTENSIKKNTFYNWLELSKEIIKKER